jgi:hypothetical protein
MTALAVPMTEGMPTGTQEHHVMDDLADAPVEAPPEARAAMFRNATRAARDTRRFALTLLLRRRITVRQYRIWCRDARADLRAVKHEVRRAGRRPRRYS